MNQLVSRYDSVNGLQIELKGQAVIEQLNLLQSHAVYRAVQESITNCLKHSNASCLKISLNVQAKWFYLNIEDNGSIPEAVNVVQESVGLRGMRERVEELGGCFAYSSHMGFAIAIALPLKEDHRK